VVKGGAGVDIASSYEINVNQDSKVWLLIRRWEAGRLLKRRGNLMGCAEKTNEQCADDVRTGQPDPRKSKKKNKAARVSHVHCRSQKVV
jgi:hypothetical protein